MFGKSKKVRTNFWSEVNKDVKGRTQQLQDRGVVQCLLKG